MKLSNCTNANVLNTDKTILRIDFDKSMPKAINLKELRRWNVIKIATTTVAFVIMIIFVTTTDWTTIFVSVGMALLAYAAVITAALKYRMVHPSIDNEMDESVVRSNATIQFVGDCEELEESSLNTGEMFTEHRYLEFSKKKIDSASNPLDSAVVDLSASSTSCSSSTSSLEGPAPGSSRRFNLPPLPHSADRSPCRELIYTSRPTSSFIAKHKRWLTETEIGIWLKQKGVIADFRHCDGDLLTSKKIFCTIAHDIEVEPESQLQRINSVRD